MNPEEYIALHDLWDLGRLKIHAEEKSVYVIESKRFPTLVMLHYKDECQYDNLWSEFSLMSRGLILDLNNKRVVAHPFNKFFNLGQMPETQFEVLQWKGPFTISEKLDGSMLILFRDPITGLNHLTTKGSFDSDHGVFATSIMTQQLKDCTLPGTLIFELIEKRFQIVIDYKKKGYSSGLYLIGYRDENGKLASYEELVSLSKELGVFYPKEYMFYTLDSLIEKAKVLSVLDEGYVLRFKKDDMLVKVKGAAYLEMHRFISRLSDRNILEAVANGTDHLLAELAPEEYREEVNDKIKNFRKRAWELTNICYNYYGLAPKESRKDFALWVIKNVESYLKTFMFQIYEAKPVDRKHMCKVIEEVDAVSGATKL